MSTQPRTNPKYRHTLLGRYPKRGKIFADFVYGDLIFDQRAGKYQIGDNINILLHNLSCEKCYKKSNKIGYSIKKIPRGTRMEYYLFDYKTKQIIKIGNPHDVDRFLKRKSIWLCKKCRSNIKMRN